jgi:spore coat protein H
MRARSIGILLVVAALGCADDDAELPVVREEPQLEAERPEGWDDASHGRGATADYARLFDGDEVRRIDIVMTPEVRQEMLDDMEGLIGKLGEGRPFGPPPDPTACEGKSEGDSCESSDPEAGESACVAFGGGDRMFCFPKSRGMMMGGRGGGPLDLIGGDPLYVPVTVRFDGKQWQHVAMRYKGNSSLRGGWGSGKLKLGFRLNFDHFEQAEPTITDQRFFGFSEMTFSSAYNDPSLIRDKLAGELAADFGLVSARCAFYRVYVDVGEGPELWGLYTMIEDPSDELIEAQFEDSSGNMYKPDGPGAQFTAFDRESFAKKTNQDAADYSDVEAAIAALHAPREDDREAWRSALEQHFDVDSFLRVLAFSRATGHWDGYGIMAHNYYLYGDPARDGKLVWISWDHNLTWQPQRMGMMMGPFGSLSVMMDEVDERWPLIRYLLDDEVHRERYRAALDEFLHGAYEKERFDARAAELHALVAPHAESEAEPFTTLEEPAAFERALDDLIQTADQRRADVTEALQ